MFCVEDAKWNHLRDRVENFPLDVLDAALPFSARLAREHGWTLVFAARVADEYKRFMLLAVAAGHPVTPSEQVDFAWHLHLLYTRNYWQEFCRDVLGKEVHHDPTQGGAREGEKFHDWYSQTLESYHRLFQEAAPTDIWPDVAKRFADAGTGRWIEQATHCVIPRPRYLWNHLVTHFRNL